jgi:hypothetical protein
MQCAYILAFCWEAGCSTTATLVENGAVVPTLRPIFANYAPGRPQRRRTLIRPKRMMAGVAGLEPATPGFGDRRALRSNVPCHHLMYVFARFSPTRDRSAYHSVTCCIVEFGSKLGSKKRGAPSSSSERLQSLFAGLCCSSYCARPQVVLGQPESDLLTVNRMVAGSNPARGASQINHLQQNLNFPRKPCFGTVWGKSIAVIPALCDIAPTLRLSLMVDVAYPHQNA